MSNAVPSLSLRVLAVAGALCLAQAAAALPALQLWGEGATWDNDTKAWIVDEPNGPFGLTALATDRHLGSNRGHAFRNNAIMDAYLSFAVIRDSGFDGSEDTSLFGDIAVDGAVVSTGWAFGKPPVGTNDNLPDQGVYPTWFVEHQISFGGFGADVFNTKGDARNYLDVLYTGFRVDFALEVSGFSMTTDDNYRVHVDLHTKDDVGGVHRYSPNSRDYEIVLAYASVPAPSPVLFMTFGLAGLKVARKLRAA